MKKFSVVKFYGHFRQHWSVYANTKEEAWETATQNGVLTFEAFYGDPFESQGYVVDSDKNEQNTVTKEEYDKWLAEAIALGMIPREEWRKTHGQ